MANIIACNLGSYRGKFSKQETYEHLNKIGLTNVEISAPKTQEIDTVQEELDTYGLTATTILASHDVKSQNFVSDFQQTLETTHKMGVDRIFLSAHGGDLPKDVVFNRLRTLGGNAQKLGITICLETHPNLANNGDIALETMNNINHPCIGINFDTANVHYHTNRKIDTVDEIQKVLDYIKAVHLKDTMGGYHAWNFPTLGEGIVDFEAVFELLNSRGFEGPFTMELEGIEGENIDRAGILNRVEDSFQYLKDLGVIH